MKLSIVMCFMGSLVGSAITPSYIQIQSKVDPSTLSLILILPMLIRIGQCHLNRLSEEISLDLPLYLAIFDVISLLMLFVSPLWFVMSDTIIGVLFIMLCANRSNLIMEKIKMHVDIRSFQNRMVTYSGVGAAVGFLISFCLCKLLDPITILLVCGFTSLVIYIPYLQINKFVRKLD